MEDYLTDIAGMFEQYYNLKEMVMNFTEKELQNLPNEYRCFLQVESKLKNLVLTGEEILELGLRRELTEDEIMKTNIYRSLLEDYRVLNKKYESLLDLHDEEIHDKIEQIEQIISGRTGSFIGPFIDSIKKVLQKP